MQEIKRCVACKKIISAESNFCPFCGNHQNEPITSFNADPLSTNNLQSIKLAQDSIDDNCLQELSKTLKIETSAAYTNSTSETNNEDSTKSFENNDYKGAFNDYSISNKSTNNAPVIIKTLATISVILIAVTLVSVLILKPVNLFTKSTTQVSTSEETSETTEENEQIEQTQVDDIVTIEERPSNDTRSLSQEDTACVIVSGLRTRNAPNGEINKFNIRNASGTEFLSQKCYKYTDQVNDGTYTWYQIDSNKWVGTKPEWIVLRKTGEEDNLYAHGERSDGSAFNFNLFYYIDQSDVDTETVSEFLNMAIPGINGITHDGFISFDAYDPSEKAKTSVYENLGLENIDNTSYSSSITGLDTFIAKLEENKTLMLSNYNEGSYIACLNENCCIWTLALDGDELESLKNQKIFNNFMAKEDVDYYLSCIYDQPIDLSTVAQYDAETQIYYSTAVLDGLGNEGYEAYVTDYTVNGDILDVTFAILSGHTTNEFIIDDYDSSTMTLDEFARSQPYKYEAKLRIMSDNSLRLISAK